MMEARPGRVKPGRAAPNDGPCASKVVVDAAEAADAHWEVSVVPSGESSRMSAAPSAVRSCLAWLTLLACVWMVGAFPVSETVCVNGMRMATPVCAACVHPAPNAAAGLTAAAPGGPHAILKALCCVERTTQVTPAVAPAAAPHVSAAVVCVTAPGAPEAVTAPVGFAVVSASASPPPRDSSPLVLRL